MKNKKANQLLQSEFAFYIKLLNKTGRSANVRQWYYPPIS